MNPTMIVPPRPKALGRKLFHRLGRDHVRGAMHTIARLLVGGRATWLLAGCRHEALGKKLPVCRLELTLLCYAAVLMSSVFFQGRTIAQGIERTWLSESLPDCALARIGTLAWRAGNPVDVLVYSPDGAMLASSGPDGSVKIWDASSGTLRRVLWADPGMACDIAFSNDGKTLASYGWCLRLWNLATGESRLLIGKRQDASGRHVAFSSSDKVIVAGNDSALIRFDAQTGNELRRWKIRSTRVLGFDLGGTVFAATASPGGGINLYDTQTGKMLPFSGARHYRCPAAVSPNGKVLGLRLEGRVEFWDPEAAKITRTVAASRYPGNCVAMSRDGQLAAWEDRQNDSIIIAVLHIGTGKRVAQLRGGHGSPRVVAFSPDSRFLASTCLSGSICVWHIPSGKRLASAAAVDSADNYHGCAALDAEGRTVLMPLSGLRLGSWEAKTGRLVRTVALDGPARAGPAGFVLSADGALVSAADNEYISIWNTYNGRCVHRFPHEQDGAPWALAISSDKRVIYVGCPDFSICAWNLTKKGGPVAFLGHTAYPTCLALSHDNKTLVSGSSDQTLRIWDISSRTEIRRVERDGAQFRVVALSPDGGTLASCEDGGTLRLWNARTGRELRCVSECGRASVCFLAGGKYLACANEHVVHIWDTINGRFLVPIVAHRGPIDSLATSAHGNVPVTGSMSDRTVHVWDVSRLLHRKRFECKVPPDCWDFLWQAMADEYNPVAASDLLAAYPKQTIAGLSQRVEAQRRRSALAVGLIGKLGGDDYAARESAQAALEALAEDAIPALQKTLSRPCDAETRRRLRSILAKVEAGVSGQQLREKYTRRLVDMLAQQPPDLPWVNKARGLLESIEPRKAQLPR
jgi:WD40 repeat protein